MEKLNKIVEANLDGIVKLYEGESRRWMENVCEDDIYRELSSSEHEAFLAQVLGTDFNDLVAYKGSPPWSSLLFLSPQISFLSIW